MRRSWVHSILCLWTAGAVVTGGCRAAPAPRPVPAPPAPPVARVAAPPVVAAGPRPQVPLVPPDAADVTSRGLVMVHRGAADPRPAPAAIEELPADATAALLARLEPLPAAPAAAPGARPPSLPPPRAGAVQPIAFLGPGGTATAATAIVDRPRPPTPAAPVTLAPPTILPEGEVAAEAEIRVRFDEPMVPVAAVDAAAPAIATITPPVPGAWRWLDTRVAAFTPTAARLPQATTFTITVPAGLRAVSGAALPAATSATFSTPPVEIKGVWPTDRLRADEPVMVTFDQAIDPAAVLARLRIVDGAGRRLPTRAVSLAEARALWARRADAFDLDAPPRHGVLLAPATAWPAGRSVRAVLAAGTPSAEGPRTSAEETAVELEIVPRFTLEGIECGGGERPRLAGARCPAWGGISVAFSTEIDDATYRAEQVQIVGQPLEDHRVYGSAVHLTAPGKAGVAATVAITGALRDVYGQPLEGPRAVTFTTTRAEIPSYLEASDGFVVLDPRFTIPQWVVRAQAVPSVRVELYQVTTADLEAYLAFEAGERATPPGRRVHDHTRTIGARHHAIDRVDLRPALSAAGTGHVVAVATAPASASGGRQRQLAWLQVTRLGLLTRVDGERVRAWVSDLRAATPGAPVPGAELALRPAGAPAPPATTTVDADGGGALALLAEAPRAPPGRDERRDIAVIEARTATDSTFTLLHSRGARAIRTQHARWYVTDDRFTYRPGETAHVKGWVRWTDSGLNPQLALPGAADTIAYALHDPQGARLASGTAPLTADGGFHLELALPRNANTGTARLELTTRGEAYTLPLSVEDFRTPAFAVTIEDDVQLAGAVPLVVGEAIEMRAEARYYGGGGLAGARTRWRATLTRAGYQPPGWAGYAFQPVPRERWHSSTQLEARGVGPLDARSASSARFEIGATPRGEPALLEVEATVTDVDRQAIRASTRPILVHPATRYVGVRATPGRTDQLQLVVTDLDGAPVAGVPIDVEIVGVLGSERWLASAAVKDRQRCQVTSAAAPVTCAYARADWQYAYTARARIADERGRPNTAELDVPWRGREAGDLHVDLDRALYRPGDTARLTIRSKVAPATVVVSFARQGVIAQRRVELPTGEAAVELPIEEAFVSNLKVLVDRVDRPPPTKRDGIAPLPRVTQVEVDVPVDVEAMRLDVRARPSAPLVEPGATATFDVEVARDGAPVAGAEVALLVVDEAVLAVSGRRHADPLAPFYEAVEDGTRAAATHVWLRDSHDDLRGVPGFERRRISDDALQGYGGLLGGGYGAGAGALDVVAGRASIGDVVAARKDFRATAAFAPVLRTDARGRARLTVKMPDSLTRFRVVALATASTRYFGLGESAIVTQRAINVRPMPPRFLTVGDTFELPVVVQNLGVAPRTVDVAVRAANLAGEGGRRVTVAGGQRVEVRFPLATARAGAATIQAIGAAGAAVDAATLTVPVYPPQTTEAFATYGTFADDAPRFERLEVPADIRRDVGGVELELASTQLQSLTDAFEYLRTYPFECVEQRSARMLATAALWDVIDAFAGPGRMSRDALLARHGEDITRLVRAQNGDGGWGYFESMGSDPFVTVQALAALVTPVTASAGPRPPAAGARASAIARGTRFVEALASGLLADLERRTRARAIVVGPRGPHDVLLAATALGALARAGRDVTARAARLHALATRLRAYPVEARARVLALLAGAPAHAAARAELVKGLLAVVRETAAGATVAAAYTEAERLLLVSENRTTAAVLDALLREAPQHALVAKLARGLLDARTRGRWASTQENLAVLAALRRYFDVYEKDTPAFTGRAWLGAGRYAEHAFAGRTTARAVARAGWEALAPGTAHDVAIARAGAGRLYYRLGITYAPARRDVPALDAGFIVRRTYRGVDDPADVVQQPDGTWRVKLGAKVRVIVEAVTTAPRHAVAVVDPLPAGFEALNPRLAITAHAGEDESDEGGEAWDHRNLRDERAEVFEMALPAGAHRLTYTVAATTPGTFFASPAKAEEMYSPETFGRSVPAVVVVQ